MEPRLAAYATTTPVETFTPPILAIYDISQEILSTYASTSTNSPYMIVLNYTTKAIN